MEEKVILTSLNGNVLVCSKEEADKIIVKQCLDILNNGFTSKIEDEK